MKWIKIWEKFDEEYELIPYSKFRELLDRQKKLLILTDKEKEKIKEIYSDVNKSSEYTLTLSNVKTIDGQCLVLKILRVSNSEVISEQAIYKLDDYWFILRHEFFNYFKCDDLTGLIKCIKDNKMVE
jgi:hypothetical protein